MKTYEIKDMSLLPESLWNAIYEYGRAAAGVSFSNTQLTSRELVIAIKQYAADEANRLLRDSEGRGDAV